MKALNPHLRYTATLAYNEALRSGSLVRPGKCAVCRKICKPHGHHRDYAKPLRVQWLCAKCHFSVHSHRYRKAPIVIWLDFKTRQRLRKIGFGMEYCLQPDEVIMKAIEFVLESPLRKWAGI